MRFISAIPNFLMSYMQRTCKLRSRDGMSSLAAHYPYSRQRMLLRIADGVPLSTPCKTLDFRSFSLMQRTNTKRFSRRSILSLEHLIQQRTRLLCERIAAFKGTKEPLSMTEMLPAFTGDIIMEYAFGFSYNQLESPNFESFHEAFVAIGSSAHVASFFPWIITVILILVFCFAARVYLTDVIQGHEPFT